MRIAALAAGIVVAVAEAQDVRDEQPTPTVLDTIEVTGSRIRRSDYEPPQPIQIITRADIDDAGTTSIGELLERLPYAGSSGLNAAVNNGGNGSELVDLRYLGPQRVLVLVNGRRWVARHPAFGTWGGVDLTTIPVAIVERIEILKDGASAVYGTDAIAGVVNIITRRDFQGGELGVQVSTFDFDEGERSETYTLSWGSFGPATSVFASLQHYAQEPVFAGDRDISRDAAPGTGVLFFGSSFTPQGNFRFTPPPGGPRPNGCAAPTPPATTAACNVMVSEGTDGGAPANFRAFTNADRYNFGPVNYLLTPSQRTSLYLQASHRLPGSIDFGTSLLYSVRESEQQLAEVPLGGGDTSTLGPTARSIYIDSTNPYNDFGYDIGRTGDADGAELPPASGQFLRRLKELGPRVFSQDVDTYHISSGLRGEMDFQDRFLRWEIGGVYSTSRQAEGNANLVNLEHVRRALGPLDTCTEAPACVSLNVLGGQGATGTGTITRPMIDYIAYEGAGAAEQELWDAFANVSAPLFQLPGGDAGLALGAGLRRESASTRPDPLVAAGTSSTNREQPTSGDLDVQEVYVELALPALTDAPFAEALELSLAARYSDYARFDAATSGKVGIKYRPFEDLMLRSSWSQAFRAPSIGELFQGLADTFPGVRDPCSNDRDRTAQQTANCGADGVPSGYTQANAQILSQRGGNPDLTPETADSLTGGFVYDPGYLDGMEFVVDWFRYVLHQGISSLGAQSILDRCYNGAQRDAAACSRVSRAPTGDIQSVLDDYINLNEISVEGVDVNLRYRFDVIGWGGFAAGADWSYLARYRTTTTDVNGNRLETPQQGLGPGLTDSRRTFPRLKGSAQLNWGAGDWKALWRVRAIKGVKDGCSVPPAVGMPQLCTDPDHGLTETGWVYYNDVQLGYELRKARTEIAFGADNVLGEDPPPNYDTGSPGFDTLTYDVPGVAPYLRIRAQF